MIAALCDDLSSIVVGATFLDEHLADETPPPHAWGEPTQPAGERLERWRSVLGLRSLGELRQYLSREHSWSRVSAILSGTCSPRAGTPSWAEVLAEVAREARSERPAYASWVMDQPFGEVLWAFAAVFRRRLEAQLSGLADLLTADAWRDLEQACITQMLDLLGDCLLAEFARGRPAGTEMIGRFFGVPPGGDDAQAYRRFVREACADGLLEVFKSYPVAARLAATKLIDLSDATCEFLARVFADRPELQRRFGQSDAVRADKLTRLELALSDPHDHARAVIIAHFGPGLAVVYKPRSLRPELAWNDLLAQVDPTLWRAEVLDRGEYGWMELVPAGQCREEHEAARFFTRLGKMLCLAYVFGGKDFHRENLIAAGEHPVLVDLETLGQPDPRPVGHSPAELEALRLRRALFASSVLRAEFLPCWHSAGSGEPRDESALSSPADHHVVTTEWRAINTDFMHKARVARPAPGSNLPCLNGVPVRAEDYAEFLLSGFADAWRRLQRLRDDLVTDTGSTAAFRDLPFRFIFRSTDVYYSILKQAASVENLKDGIDFGIELQALYRAVLGETDTCAWKSIVAAEVTALQRGDIPRFDGRADEHTLRAGKRLLVRNYFETTGAASIRLRLEQLDEPRLEQELRIIRNALLAERARSRRGASRTHALTVPPDAALLGDADALTAARSLGERLLAISNALPDGSLCWTGLVYRDEAAGFRTEVLNDSFYEGNAGIALFLAALHRAEAGRHFREASLRALQPLRDALRSLRRTERERFVDRLGLGAGSGVGGLIYALTRIAVLLNDASLIDDAVALSGWIAADRIENEVEWDVLNGLSGAAAGLMALAKEQRRPELLEMASRCGHRIVALHRQGRLTKDAEPASFAHGVSGTAGILARLGRLLGDPVLAAAAQALIAEEAHQRLGWDDTPVRTGWCKGAAGVGFSALVRLDAGDASAEEALKAIQPLSAQSHPPLNQICCGAFGQVDLLATAGERLSRPDMSAAARRLAGALLSHATAQGGFHLLPGVPAAYEGPSLFQGLAGIGYGLLRLRDPEQFPSVLMLG